MDATATKLSLALGISAKDAENLVLAGYATPRAVRDTLTDEAALELTGKTAVELMPRYAAKGRV